MDSESERIARDVLARMSEAGEQTAHRELNMDAIAAMDAHMAESVEPWACPFCGMSYDLARFRMLVEIGDFEAVAEYMAEMMAHPVNAAGGDWGQRGEAS